MSKADDIFVKEFGIIIGLLLVFAILMFFLARIIGAESYAAVLDSPSAVAQRLAPVGSVRIAGSEEAAQAAKEMELAAAAPAAESSAADRSGEEVYKIACAACHDTGVAGAPAVTSKAAWESRYGQGLDALVHNAVNGKNAMPARGGNPSLSDNEVRSAVEYMLVAAGLEVGSSTGSAPAPAAESAQTEQVAAATTEQPATATDATTEAAADGKPGDEVYNMACVACHATGAANAPKVGEKSAWNKRVAQGMDALVSNAVNGKNLMPAKGGMPNLTDGDVRNAVVYMLEETGVSAQ